VLENSLNGVLAGKGAGCYVIAVPSEYTKQENFDRAEYAADDLFCATRHIKDLLKK
jgi:beta-phosphoglucomutase-like phosphatase (HAD superfamily)